MAWKLTCGVVRPLRPNESPLRINTGQETLLISKYGKIKISQCSKYWQMKDGQHDVRNWLKNGRIRGSWYFVCLNNFKRLKEVNHERK